MITLIAQIVRPISKKALLMHDSRIVTGTMHKNPWQMKVAVGLVAVAALGAVFVAVLRGRRHGRAIGSAREWLEKNGVSWAPVLLEFREAEAIAEPAPAYIRAWYQNTYGAKLPRWASRDLMYAFWRERFFKGALYRFPRELVYVGEDAESLCPPVTPFESRHTSGYFVLATNRGRHFISYLVEADMYHKKPNPVFDLFSMGYTALLGLELMECVKATAERPLAVPGRAGECTVSVGRYLVLRDPLIATSKSPHSGDILVGSFEQLDIAVQCAKEFASRTGFSTCVARVVDHVGWH